MDIYIRPEIARRQAHGQLPVPLALRAAQLICFADGRPNLVRLNEEVQAIAQVKLRGGVPRSKGETVYDDEIEGLDTVRLPESEDPDCGHATVLRFRDRWFVVFDFRYNLGKAAVVLNRAEEFFELAENARGRDAWASMIYVLAAAAESAARAELLLVPSPTFEKSKTHAAVLSRFNQWARLGNVAVEHKAALNRLMSLRPAAGHGLQRFSIDPAEADALLDAVRGMIARATLRLSRRD